MRDEIMKKPPLFKVKPFAHQLEALRLSQDKPVFALLMEQGTGKSKVAIDTVAHLWRGKKIDTALVIAPKGVAPAWIREQLPDHMPDDVAYNAALWKAKSRMSKAATRLCNAVLAYEDGLRIFIMNTEAFGSTSDALDFAIDVLDASQSAIVIVDESHRIKTPNVHTTKRILNLRIRSAYRRILTGTVADKPFDLFSQFGFLDPAILQTDSFTAFRSEYAEMLPDNSGLMRHIAMRIPKKWKGRYIDEITGQPTDEARDADGLPNKKFMEPAYLPQVIAKNDDGTPKYRDLDRLHRLIAPHSFRVLKVDCLDLPPKVYNRFYTEMSDRQRELYEQIRDQHRVEWEDGQISSFSKLTVYLRLQQVICGYLPDATRELRNLFPSWKENPRILSLMELLEDQEGQRAVIWCRFIEDINKVTDALRETYGADSVVHFYGDVSDKDREEAVARYEGVRRTMGRDGKLLREEPVPDGERARFMVAQQRAGGIGQTWVAGSLSVHYSNTFSLIDRLQSEDRLHRIGQTRSVRYIDIECEETIDSVIVASMRSKKDVADVINGDRATNWLDPIPFPELSYRARDKK